jgi:uncharacterized membrane protein
MNATSRFLAVCVLLVLIDIPWLAGLNASYSAVVQKIQGGGAVRMRPLAGLVVYPAMAYLVLKAKTIEEAFLIGAATYAVYDFTVLAVFKDYPLWIAVADTLWGGVLFATVAWLVRRYLA